MADDWMDVRCPNPRCPRRRVRFDNTIAPAGLLARYRVGSVSRLGEIKIACHACGTIAVVDGRNQAGDDQTTFSSAVFQQMLAARRQMVAAQIGHTTS